MKAKVPILHIEPLRYPEHIRDLLTPIGDVDYVEVKNKAHLIAVFRQKPYEIIFVRLGVAIDKGVMKAAPNLRFIVTPTTGLNHIDLDSATAHNIKVISLKGETDFLAKIQSTSEHTWGILLNLIRKIGTANDAVREGGWFREPFLGIELHGKTLGIIGYGRLGRIVAGYGRAFGMRVLVNDTAPNQIADLPEDMEAVSLDELLGATDVLSLHIPYSKENYHFLDAEKLSKTKSGLILVNTSRGEVLSEQALLQNLGSGHIRGAAIDVIEGDSSWESEVPAGHPLIAYLRNNNNLIITPHIGGYALESIEGTRAFVIKKLIKVL